MLIATDTCYHEDAGLAVAAGVLFPAWESGEVGRVVVERVPVTAPYEPGAFYKRELPPLLALLERVDEALEAILIDGYVVLGAEGRPGLGMHLYEHLGRTVPVVGVAKSGFRGTPAGCRLLRGDSGRPLYVTAAGLSQEEARNRVAKMHGAHRIPTVLRRADRLCRDDPSGSG